MNPYSIATPTRQHRSPLPIRTSNEGVSAPMVLPDGSVAVAMELNGRYVDYMTDDELSEMQAILDEAAKDAKALSQGPYSLADLRRMGHPYGMGRRRGLGRLQGSRAGVSNMDVLNRQSGRTARSWKTRLDVSKSKVFLFLINMSKVAKYTAKGTRFMKPHGPHRTALARKRAKAIQRWRVLSQRAAMRARAMEAIRTGGDVRG